MRQKRLLARLMPANERITLLASLVAGEYKDREDVGRLLPNPSTKPSEAQVNFLRGLLNVDVTQQNYESRCDVLALLYTMRSLEGVTPDIRESVLQASNGECDRIWQLRTNKGPDARARESAWTSFVSTIGWFGHRELLTPSFWRALESEGFRDGGTLALYADPELLQTLKDVRKRLEKDQQITAKLNSLITGMSLVLEYPAIKQVGPIDLRLAVDDLPQVPVDKRNKWVAERVAKARDDITKERQRLEKELAPQPSTRPASARNDDHERETTK